MKKLLQLSLCLLCVLPFHAGSITAQEKDETATIQIDEEGSQETFLVRDDSLQSRYAILINLDDGEVLLDKNSDERMYPASMTKAMTVLTALDHIDDTKKMVTITAAMLEGLQEADASVAGFSVGETVTIEDLLYGVLLPSGADACRALAFTISGSEAAFVELMNQKAKDLGLSATHFVNTTGLHEDAHYTTAREMAVIIEKAIENPEFFKVFTSKRYTTSSTPQHPQGLDLISSVYKQSTVISDDESIITGGKTGYTLEGGLCLASIGYHDNAHYLLVTGFAGRDASYPSHVQDAYTIYQTLYETYDYQKILDADTEIDTIKVRYNLSHRKLRVSLPEELHALIDRSYDLQKIQVIFEGADEVEAPIEEKQLLGEIVVKYEGETIKRIPFYAPQAIGRNWLLYGASMVIDFIVSIRYILLGLLLMFILWVCWRRYKVLQRRKRRRTQRRRK